MKKTILVVGVIVGLVACGLFGQRALAVRGTGTTCVDEDISKFPYGFLCGAAPGNPYNAPLTSAPIDATSDGSAQQYNSDYTGSGATGFKDVPANTNLTFTTGYNRDGVPKKAKGAQANSVLVWVGIDIPSSLYPNISTNGTVTQCPGNYAGSTRVAVYNYRDLADATNVDASPVAYNPTNGQGIEDCGQEGKVIYWQNDGSEVTPRYSFTLNVGSNNGTKFCVRENISVAFDSDNGGLWPGSTNFSGPDQNKISTHVAKQSVRKCYNVVNSSPEGDINAASCQAINLRAYDRDPTRATRFYVTRLNTTGVGTSNVLGSRASPLTAPDQNYHNYDVNLSSLYPLYANKTITFYLWAQDLDNGNWYQVDGGSAFSSNCGGPPSWNGFSADCNILYLNDVFDPDMRSAGVHFGGIVYHRNPDGSKGGQAGNVDGHGAGSFPFDYTSWNNPYEDSNNNGWIIDLSIYDVQTNGSDGWFQFNQIREVVVDYPCYQASCKGYTVNGALPGTTNGVQTNQTYSITFHFHADTKPGSTNYLPANLYKGPNEGFPLTATIQNYPRGPSARVQAVGRDVAGQSDYDVTVGGLEALDKIGTMNFTAYADYWQLFSISTGNCDPSIDVYEPFTLNPTMPQPQASDDEDPSTVTFFTTSVQSTGTTANVTVGTESYFSVPGSKIATFGPAAKTYPPGVNTPVLNGTVYTIPPGYKSKAGDQYCAYLHLDMTTGFVGPGGKIAGTPTPYNPAPACYTISNKPYFKAYGTGISAGGDFKESNSSCSGGGELAGWFNNTAPTYQYGSSAELSALAMIKISGVASAHTTNSRPPTELTFANTTATTPSSSFSVKYDPDLGGSYGATNNCLTSTNAPNNIPNISASTAVSSLANGTYQYTGGQLQLDGGAALNPSTNVTIYAYGDVYIHSDIKYNPAGWTATTVPQFKLVTTGNIYIDPGVTVLDGTYIAKPKANSPGPPAYKGSIIYTCSAGLPSPYAPMQRNLLYDNCKNQLTVHGSFVAEHVNMMRTFGSMRDERPNIINSAGATYNPATPVCFSENYNDPGYSCPGRNPSISWSCLAIDEPADIWWSDNNFCVKAGSPVSFNWSWSGNPGGCSLWAGPGYGWSDNYLCSSNGKFTFSSSDKTTYDGPNEAIHCTHFYDGADASTGSGGGGAWLCENLLKTSAVVGSINPPSLPLSCSNAGIRSATNRDTCAAEVFDFSPEVYMTVPGDMPPNNGAPTWDAITQLPPIL